MPKANTQRAVRNTPQKELVRQALAAAPGFVSAQQLHRGLSESGDQVGLATVYRQLNVLAESGEADTVSVESGQLFRACDPAGHHHHLVCERCGWAAEIHFPDEQWIHEEAAKQGFEVSRHVLEVFGYCAQCSAELRSGSDDGPGS